MTTIGPIGSSLGSVHAQVLKRAEQALETQKPSEGFTDRITNAIEQVAEAQNKTASLTKAYEMGMENDISKVMVSQQGIARLPDDTEHPQQGAQRLQGHHEHAGLTGCSRQTDETQERETVMAEATTVMDPATRGRLKRPKPRWRPFRQRTDGCPVPPDGRTEHSSDAARIGRHHRCRHRHGVLCPSQQPERTTLYAALPEAEKARVVDALKNAGVDVVLDPTTGDVIVPVADYHSSRMTLAAQGLPASIPDGYDSISDIPMGSSRSVESARLKQSQEIELARSISEIEGLVTARVHLAIPEKSVFARASTPPSASVFVQMENGRSLSRQQVDAIVHLSRPPSHGKERRHRRRPVW